MINKPRLNQLVNYNCSMHGGKRYLNLEVDQISYSWTLDIENIKNVDQ